MFDKLIPLSLATLIAIGGPVLAQTTSTGDAQVPGAQLDMGEQVSTEPQLGERYSKEKYGDWDLACVRTGTQEDPCSLLQIMADSQGNPVAEFSLFRLAEGGQAVAGATLIVPLEVLLTAQVAISIDGAPGKRYNFSFCNQIGCVAQIGLTQADIDTFKNGKKAIVTLVPAPAPDQTISLTVSLNGFTAGYEVVDVVAN